jgi:hypothetical protein
MITGGDQEDTVLWVSPYSTWEQAVHSEEMLRRHMTSPTPIGKEHSPTRRRCESAFP